METLQLPPLFHPNAENGPCEVVPLVKQQPDSINVWHWKNVKNAAKLRQGIINNEMMGLRVPDACFLDARMVRFSPRESSFSDFGPFSDSIGLYFGFTESRTKKDEDSKFVRGSLVQPQSWNKRTYNSLYD
jgi:hypothetical protein